MQSHLVPLTHNLSLLCLLPREEAVVRQVPQLNLRRYEQSLRSPSRRRRLKVLLYFSNEYCWC